MVRAGLRLGERIRLAGAEPLRSCVEAGPVEAHAGEDCRCGGQQVAGFGVDGAQPGDSVGAVAVTRVHPLAATGFANTIAALSVGLLDARTYVDHEPPVPAYAAPYGH